MHPFICTEKFAMINKVRSTNLFTCQQAVNLLSSGVLRSFFQNWRNRGKPVLILISARDDSIKEHFGFETKINLVETIEEYKKLGVIKYGFMSSLYFLEIAKFQIQ